MTRNVVSLGIAPWTREQILDSLEEFVALYEHRPFEDNDGGMRSAHLFLAWFAMKALQPKIIIESGVLRGQGTWAFEQACPDARFYCIEPFPQPITYKPEKAQYFLQDFSTLTWDWLSQEERDNTVLFFDDHKNAFKRLKDVKAQGFTHVMFEDNYAGGGDVYSLKTAWMGIGFNHSQKPELFVSPNTEDADYLRQNLEVYQELPPVFPQPWYNEDPYVGTTMEPLLREVEAPYQQLLKDEAEHYYWLCYAKIKR